MFCSTLIGYRPQAGGVDVANERDNGQHVRPVADVRIRRGRILEDAIAQILPLGPVARGRLAVRYVNAAGGDEAGIDAGGLFKELLADVCHDGFDPNAGCSRRRAWITTSIPQPVSIL